MSRLTSISLWLLIFFLPFQLGKHFWTFESLVLGRRIDYLSPTIYLTDILLLVFLLSSFIFARKKIPLVFNKLVLAAVLFSGISIYLQGVTWLSIYFSLKLIEYAAFASVLIKSKPKLGEILTPLSLSVIITVILALLQFLSQSSIGGIWYWLGERAFTSQTPGIAQIITQGRIFLRPYSSFPHPNALGGFLVVLLPLFLWKPARLKSWKYFLHRSALYFIFLGIFLSFSRSAWLVALFIVGAIFLKSSWGKRQKLVLILCLFCLGLIVEELLLGRFISLGLAETESITVRLKLLESARLLFLQSPIFGIGLGRFISGLATLRPLAPVLQPVHSIYALLAVETGICGLGLFLFIFGLAIKRALSQKNLALVLSLAAILLLGSVDHYFISLQQTQILLVLVLSLAAVVYPLSGVQ